MKLHQNQDNDYLWGKRRNEERHKGDFLGVNNVLSLDLGTGYTGVFSW